MGKEGRVRGGSARRLRRLLLHLAVACLLASSAGARARGAETAEAAQNGSAPGEQRDLDEAPATDSALHPPEERDADVATAEPEDRRRPAEERAGDEETTRALERALVRRGGLVLRAWSAEIEPGVAYRYQEPNGRRRDTFSSSLTLRLGLPWAAQGEVRVPFVLHDRRSGAGKTSGLGDVVVGLTKLLLMERKLVPELLFTARWKTTTGASGREPTGSGAHGLQGLLTALKRDDPVVLLGSLYYVWNIRSGDVDLGDAAGVILGIALAATPRTSVLLDLDLASISATAVGGQRSAGTERLSGLLEIGVSTILVRDLLLNFTAEIGVTPDAPDLQLIVALPFRW
jgi:hypothetical protein